MSKSTYDIFPDTARNFEKQILADLRKGWDVTVSFREPVRIGKLMVTPELADQVRIFLGSMSRPNPKRSAKRQKAKRTSAQ